MFCIVYGYSDSSNQGKEKLFFLLPKVVVDKGENYKKLTEQCCKKWISSLCLWSGGMESANARVCSDHFIRAESVN